MKRSCKRTNDIIEDHGDYLVVDISTSKHPNAQMAIDTDVWEHREGGRVSAVNSGNAKYIYAQHWIGGKRKYFHHQVIAKVDGLEVDHVEHPTMTFVDNRRSNLRNVTHAHNMINRGVHRDNTSGAAGVSWDKRAGKWLARIKIDGKRKRLGYFDDKSDAIGARQQAEREYFGEYAFGVNN